jgi:peptidoglycan hydrolase-like protein with peptidoglycan-binding domain
VVNRLSGTITWLPEEGAVVKPDGRLYAIDGSPVILMDGSVPAYRELSSSVSDGPDVAQLERNLRALGYDKGKAIELDDSWDAGTTAAVVHWQEAHGLDQTGTIELGRVIFQPGKRRIESIDVTLGGDTEGSAGSASGGSSQGDSTGGGATQSGAASNAAGGADASGDASADRAVSSQVMITTSTRPIVTVDLDTSKESLARVGAKVSVELPSGDTIRGSIASVGKVATSQSSESEGSDQGSTATEDAAVEVTIRLGRRIKALDQAPATVNFEQNRRRDVLAVPVTALLARAGGAYAVEVRDGGGRRLVPVTPGLYAGGYVEIEAEGLRPGMTVTDARV